MVVVETVRMRFSKRVTKKASYHQSAHRGATVRKLRAGLLIAQTRMQYMAVEHAALAHNYVD
eukprot:scaffold91588_cov24-Tisochrysis_lutea.AAC.2